MPSNVRRSIFQLLTSPLLSIFTNLSTLRQGIFPLNHTVFGYQVLSIKPMLLNCSLFPYNFTTIYYAVVSYYCYYCFLQPVEVFISQHAILLLLSKIHFKNRKVLQVRERVGRRKLFDYKFTEFIHKLNKYA